MLNSAYLKISKFAEDNPDLVVLGPDDIEVYSKPIDAGGFNVTNLDIDILNNKSALIADEKLRPLPVQPEDYLIM